MRIDSHQHFWRYNAEEYSWINDSMKLLKRDYLPYELEKEIKKINFDGSIAIQARQNLQETEWLLNLSNEYDFIKGVVGWVDLQSKEVSKQIEKFINNKKFVGVRHVIQDEPDKEFMLRSDFQQGIKILKEYHLPYDILIYNYHLPVAIQFIEKFPEQKFILNHIAKPNIKNKEIKEWGKYIRIISKFNNLYCKLSGMVTEGDWYNWKIDDFRPYLDIIFENFECGRLMIGSDWPVCTLCGDYASIMKIIINYINKFSEKEQQFILGKTAMNVYNIKEK